MVRIYIGTSGFSQQQFYPTKTKSEDKLKFYSTKFNSVEINSSFYHFPRVTTLENWEAQVSKDFVFAFKIHQTITRSKQINQQLLDNWFNSFVIFASKKPKHVMLFQFAASYGIDYDYFKQLLKVLPKTFLYAFEFRHPSWFNEDVYKVVNSFGGSVVLNDGPWPKVEVKKNPFLFVRFHGKPKLYFSNYSERELKDYAKLFQQNIKAGKNVYVYFNNDAAGHATHDALQLQKLLED